VQSKNESLQDLRDPTHYCQVLIPLITTPDTFISNQDILLTSRAKLISLIRKYYINDSTIKPNRPKLPQQELATNTPRTPQTYSSSKRLAASTNAQLGWWRDNLAGYNLPPEETRQIDICYLFAQVLVNITLFEDLDDQPDAAIRRVSLKTAVDAAAEALRLASRWTSKELACLPCFDLYVRASIEP
jgi:hypothetical protein